MGYYTLYNALFKIHQKQWLTIDDFQGPKCNQLSGNQKNKVHYQRWRSHRVNWILQSSLALSQKLDFQIKYSTSTDLRRTVFPLE